VGEDAVRGAFRSSSRRAGLVVVEGDGAEVAAVSVASGVVVVAASAALVAVVDLEAAVAARAGETARDRRMTKQASSRTR